MIRLSNFPTEDEAKLHLENLLRPHFVLQREVWVRHIEARNRLHIDYLARPRPNIQFPFPFNWFGIETKSSCADGSRYNDAIKQAIDYTHCIVDDPRPPLGNINGRRIERTHIFPARGLTARCPILAATDTASIGSPNRADSYLPSPGADCPLPHPCGDGYCINRLAGKFHVGMIYEDYRGVTFFACADRQWSSWRGERASKHNTRQTVGSGVPRREQPNDRRGETL